LSDVSVGGQRNDVLDPNRGVWWNPLMTDPTSYPDWFYSRAARVRRSTG
jgi:hypothetical protein